MLVSVLYSVRSILLYEAVIVKATEIISASTTVMALVGLDATPSLVVTVSSVRLVRLG